jgi:hypothetical protein
VTKSLRCSVVLCAICATLLLAGCGPEQERIERGAETKTESDVAVPESYEEMALTEEERRAKEAEAEQEEQAKRLEELEQ